MIVIDGQTYKLGSHGYVFRLDDGEWVRSENDQAKRALGVAKKTGKQRSGAYE